MMRTLSAILCVAGLVACADATTPVSPLAAHAVSRNEYCDPEFSFYSCEPVEESGYPAGIPIPGVSRSSCYGSDGDSDFDVLRDECEDAMAAAFAPELRMSSNETNWNPQMGAAGMVGGEYYYAVTRVNVDGEPRVRILYMPAYYRDEGNVNQSFMGHTGDSEYIAVEIGPVPNTPLSYERWQTRRVFLSAHCGAYNDTACGWYGASAFDGTGLGDGDWYNGQRLGAPVVWTSQDKHANYVSYHHCTYESWGVDYCGHSDVRERFPISSDFNIGGWYHRRYDFVGPRRPGSRGLPGSAESFWTSTPFHGWLERDSDGGSTPYAHHLNSMGFFPTTGPDPVDCSNPDLIVCQTRVP